VIDPRKPVFEAIRDAKGSISPDEVPLIDALLDRLQIPRQGAGQSPRRRGINKAGLEIIKRSEGLRLKAYKCPADVWTIGYGSTGSHVRPGLVITEAQADELLRSDVRRFEDDVAALIKDAPTTDNQFSALVSLAFNIGSDIDQDSIPEGLGDSSLLRKHLAGDYAGAALEFGKWIYGGGKRLEGLVTRRAAEAALYRTRAQ